MSENTLIWIIGFVNLGLILGIIARAKKLVKEGDNRGVRELKEEVEEDLIYASCPYCKCRFDLIVRGVR